MRISLIQLGIRWEDQNANYRSAERLIKKAADSGAQLVCLPELFSTGVTLDSGKFAEDTDGITCRFLRRQATDNGVHVMGSFIEENGRRLPYNASITYGPDGRIKAKYRKSHLFTYGGEDMGYTPGEPEVRTFKIHGFTACPVICYDLRFPEMFLSALEGGADLFVVQANWPDLRKSHWEALLQARAIESQAFVAGVNQVGESPKNRFFGGSGIINPMGRIIAKAAGREGAVSCDISLEEAKNSRKKYPFQKERRKMLCKR